MNTEHRKMQTVLKVYLVFYTIESSNAKLHYTIGDFMSQSKYSRIKIIDSLGRQLLLLLLRSNINVIYL